MAADIFNTKTGTTVINNGSITVMVATPTTQVDDEDAVHTPTISEIETKYEGRWTEA